MRTMALDSGSSLLVLLACSWVVACEPASVWPSNEPTGFRPVTDQAWDDLKGNGWSYLRRTGSKDDDILRDPSSPRSAGGMLRIVFTPDMRPNTEPSVHWVSLPVAREVYTSWWIKLSPNWIPNPAGGGKITFLWTHPEGAGQVYTNLYHPSDDGSVEGAPYRIGANTEWAPYGQKIWYPNVKTTWINPGEWHWIEFYYKWGTAGDGVIRWWVDGELNGDYQDVNYPSNGVGFRQFEFAPTVQDPGPAERYMYIDHTYVSTP